jgi:Ricin-type beta-trefoil lectin domain
MIKYVRAAMAIGVTSLCTLVLTALPASASDPVEIEITNVVTGKCIDVKHGSKNVHAEIQQYHCNGTGAQKWEVLTATGGFLIFNRQSLLCLDVRADDTVNVPNGTTLQLYLCAGAAVWQFKDPFHNTGQLLHPASGKCVDLDGGSSADGATIQMFDCITNDTNQLWTVPGVNVPD